MTLCGCDCRYPKDEATTTVVIVTLAPLGDWERVGHKVANAVYDTTGLPGRTVRVLRKSKAGLTSTMQRLRQVANLVENNSLLAKKKKVRRKHELNLEDANEDDLEEPEKFEVHQQVLAWDKGGKINRHTGLQTNARWALSTVMAVTNGGKSYTCQFHDTQTTAEIKPHHVRKMSPEFTANPARAAGLGIWEYDDMSDEEDLDWASEEEEEDYNDPENEQQGDEVDGEKKEKKGTKQQLSFGEFWEVSLLIAAAGGDEKACAAALGRLATAGEQYPDMPTLAKAVETACSSIEASAATASHDSTRQADEETEVLLNLMYAPRHSRLHSVAKTLARLENLSHILAWASCAPDGPGSAVSSDQRGGASTAKERMLAQATRQAPRGCPGLEMIELPRLKLSFTSRPDEDGTIRLFSMDHANLFVSNTTDPRAVKLIAGIPHSLLVANAQREVSILVSVWKVARPNVLSHPFSTSLVLNHASGPWNAAQDQHYFLYPIHVSMSFLVPRGLTSAMYLLLLRLLHRNYAAAFRLAESVASDSSFPTPAKHIFSDLAIANSDYHPDCQACRTKLALVTIDSGEGTPWDL